MASAAELKKRYKRKELFQKVWDILATAGTLYIACASPRFVTTVIPYLIKNGFHLRSKQQKRQIGDLFTYLRRRGYLDVQIHNHQMHISLTEEGKKKAKQYQINDLKIVRPKTWDGFWRILVFDIPEATRVKREALRGKLKELDFSYLQRSVWIHPHPCHEELQLLREFFGFTSNDYLYFETRSLGPKAYTFEKKYGLGKTSS